MASDADKELVCNEVINALSVISALPHCSRNKLQDYEANALLNAQRLAAQQKLENLRDSCAIGAEVGFMLATAPTNSVAIQHCGLQWVEAAIRLHWNELAQDRKVLIRENCVLSLLNGQQLNGPIVREELARCFVEMLKREWPQNWQEFMANCRSWCQNSAESKEICLMILTRLIEDVITVGSDLMTNMNRKREVNHGIVKNLPGITAIAIAVLKAHKETVSIDNQSAVLCQRALELQAEVLEFINAKDLAKCQPAVIIDQILSFLPVADHDLNRVAADCLGRFVSRKGKLDDVKDVLALLRPDRLQVILNVINSLGSLESQESYNFIKYLCSLLCNIGHHLCALWGPKGTIQQPPESFNDFLQMMLIFMQLPCLYLKNEAAAVFAAFIQHATIKENAQFITALQTVLEGIPQWSNKGQLSKGLGDPKWLAEAAKFDQDEDKFPVEYAQLREKLLRILRDSTKLNYEWALKVCLNWFDRRIAQSSPGEGDADEWESMMRYFRSFFDAFSSLEQFKTPEVQKYGKEMLRVVLERLCGNWPANTTVLLDHEISLSSCLLVFLPYCSEMVEQVLVTLSAILRSEANQSEMKSAKQHALNVLINLATDYYQQIMPHQSKVVELAGDLFPRLSLAQRAKLLESVAAVSNHINNYQQQIEFLSGVGEMTTQYWTSDQLESCLRSPESFMKFAGLLDAAPIGEDDTSEFRTNRKELFGQLAIVEAIVSRMKPPNSPELRQSGGYLSPSGDLMHPAFEYINKFILPLFRLAKCLNGIYSPTVQGLVHESYGLVTFDIPEVEKHSVASTNEHLLDADEQNKLKKTTASDHVRAWIGELTEKIQTVIGLLVAQCGWQFYSLPDAAVLLEHGCLDGLQVLLDLRMRNWVRRTWKRIGIALAIKDAPEAHLRCVYPSFCKLLIHMKDRLIDRWGQVKTLQHTDFANNPKERSKEEALFQDHITAVTRDYILFLQKVLYLNTSSVRGADENQDSSNMEGTATAANGNTGDKKKSGSGQRQTADDLSPLACLLLEDRAMRFTLVETVFTALTWDDTLSAMRTVSLCESIVTKIASTVESQLASNLLSVSIQCLRIHGLHENSSGVFIGLCANLYELLRPKFKELREVLQRETQSVDDKTITSYEDRVLWPKVSGRDSQLPDRIKKDMFRKIVKDVLGQHLGERGKIQIHIRDLRALEKPEKPETAPVDVDLRVLELFGTS